MTASRGLRGQSTYDVSPHTTAPLRIEGTCRFDASPEKVWARVADHERLGEFVPLVGKVIVDSLSGGEVGTGSERVCSLTGMGKLRERFLVWDPPTGYVYSGSGRLVPIRDHAGILHVTGDNGGSVLTWQQYFRTTRSPLGLIFPWVTRQIMRRAFLNLGKEFGGGEPSVRKVS